ncbi:hypothetical protein [Kordiimonas sp.]|uniref:hypothetical protein n=1 Tax=Kordiimonas sp. TaxID=1970157 RepID=UPI003A9579C8
MKAFLGGILLGGVAVGAVSYYILEVQKEMAAEELKYAQAQLVIAQSAIQYLQQPPEMQDDLPSPPPEPTITVRTIGNDPIPNFMEDGPFHFQTPTFTVLTAKPLLEVTQETVERLCIFGMRTNPSSSTYGDARIYDVAIYLKDDFKLDRLHAAAGTFEGDGPTLAFVIEGTNTDAVWQSGRFKNPTKQYNSFDRERYPEAPADIYFTLTGDDTRVNLKRLQSLTPSREVTVCEGADVEIDNLTRDLLKFDPSMESQN